MVSASRGSSATKAPGRSPNNACARFQALRQRVGPGHVGARQAALEQARDRAHVLFGEQLGDVAGALLPVAERLLSPLSVGRFVHRLPLPDPQRIIDVASLGKAYD